MRPLVDSGAGLDYEFGVRSSADREKQVGASGKIAEIESGGRREMYGRDEARADGPRSRTGIVQAALSQ
jgi:hypothetical protein